MEWRKEWMNVELQQLEGNNEQSLEEFINIAVIVDLTQCERWDLSPAGPRGARTEYSQLFSRRNRIWGLVRTMVLSPSWSLFLFSLFALLNSIFMKSIWTTTTTSVSGMKWGQSFEYSGMENHKKINLQLILFLCLYLGFICVNLRKFMDVIYCLYGGIDTYNMVIIIYFIFLNVIHNVVLPLQMCFIWLDLSPHS